MAGELHVFDVHTGWTKSGTRTYKVRKTHQKSRYGCKTCKLRRIKCDEKKPTCTSCKRKLLPCGYPEESKNHAHSTDPGPSALIWPGQRSPSVLSETDSFSTDRDLAILHHFANVTSQDFFPSGAMYGSQTINILPLAKSHAHIMHAVIAAAARHLREAAPQGEVYEEIEAQHWLSASSHFRVALKSRFSEDSVELDPVLTTCMLLNLLAFANVGNEEVLFSTNRWPFTPTTPDSLQWLYIQLGLSSLIMPASEQTKGESIWLPLFLSVGSVDMYDDRPGVDGIPASYISLFEITPSSVCEIQDDALGVMSGHPYLRLVRRILTLRKMYNEATSQENHNMNCLKYTQFMQAVDANVVRRLEEKDPRTMLLYAQCMALLCAVQNWWCRPRALSECCAVTKWLDENCGSWLGPDGWLEFPAAATGYRLTWSERLCGISTDSPVSGGIPTVPTSLCVT